MMSLDGACVVVLGGTSGVREGADLHVRNGGVAAVTGTVRFGSVRRIAETTLDVRSAAVLPVVAGVPRRGRTPGS